MSRSTARQGHKSRWKARDAKYREEHRTRRREKREKLAHHISNHPYDLDAEASWYRHGFKFRDVFETTELIDSVIPTPEVDVMSHPPVPRPSDTAVWDADLGCWVEEIEL